MTRLVWGDAETTGIRPDMGAEIWELALIVRDEPGSAVSDEEWAWHIRPGLAHADPTALKIGGYYERCRVRGLAPGIGRRVTQPPDVDPDPAVIDAEGIAQCVAGLLNGAHLIAANPAFDAGHLDAFLRRTGECLTADYHYTDIGSLVRGWAHGSFANPVVPWPLKLADAARLARIDPDHYEVHTALGDARLARDVFDAVTGGAA
jgi:hypothetical protein